MNQGSNLLGISHIFVHTFIHTVMGVKITLLTELLKISSVYKNNCNIFHLINHFKYKQHRLLKL